MTDYGFLTKTTCCLIYEEQETNKTIDFKNLLTVIPKNELKIYSLSEDVLIDYYTVLGYDTLIPNQNFAKLFNKHGELEVGDWIVKVTPNGTYKFKKTVEVEFYDLYLKNPTMKGLQIDSETYQITNDILFYDTFKADDSFYTEVETFSDSEQESSTLYVSTRSIGAQPDFNSFTTFSADRHTIVGGWIQSLIGAKKNHTLKYQTNSNRRLNGSFYSYNYGVYVENGVEGYTEKKNWIGWSETKSDELRVGWKDVLLTTTMDKSSSELIKGLKQYNASPIQYMDIPGTMYKMNLKTLTIPGYDASSWENNIGKGVKAGIEFLKKKYDSKNQSEIETAQALLIAADKTYYIIIKNENVVKYNCKKYVHIFGKQPKFMIVINPFSFIASITQTVVQSTELNAPTIKKGEIYVCAKFGNEWQGMKIIKQ
ncbi:MAG: hypothetical protein LBG96_00960 [Tannerella sp.]|nr:hypothetical protein [Tannerella sp.]